MNNKGFSLIECTIYLALFSFTAMLFLGMASRVQLKFMNVSYVQEDLHRQTIAFDLLRRDLMSASQHSAAWDFQQPVLKPSVYNQAVSSRAIFKKLTLTAKNLPQKVAVSWFIGSQGLMRAQGEYDFAKHEWINKTSCIVCKSIKQIDFVLQKCLGFQNSSGLQKSNGKKENYSGVWVVYKSSGAKKLGTERVAKTFGQKLPDQKFFVQFRNRVVV